MKTAKELYADSIEDGYFSEYQPMIDEIGKVIIQVDDNDYQGDSRVLLYENRRIGLLIFGWGSCSGCDALQACQNIDEVQTLFDEMKKDVKWFDSKADMMKYITEKDWELDYSWHCDETKSFIEMVRAYLEGDDND
jgi:hypothetical protein